ncbi:hypothetical protein AVEN_247019-1 [Araneus ventricosus]|uniref:Uncharacterized protein n=1 Tax=Araneus ventricosus TaxID=182803 RepID=A0A4Y2T5V6_ARAVE|nr:hypothetical protein AVEN_247019-1 [Araneus ventricosus]
MTRTTTGKDPPLQMSTPHQLEERNVSSSKKDYEVFSLSELNELVNWATGFGETVDYLDLYKNDDVGDVSLNFQQDEYRESEQSRCILNNTIEHSI